MPTPLRIAYQGEPGAYSEQAALKFFHPPIVPDFAPCASFRDLFEALNSNRVDRVVLPIENSLAGTIHVNLDLLLRYKSIFITGEVDLHIHHCLLALPGTKLTDVSIVRSHPIALAQCPSFLQTHALLSEVAYDTAGSAKKIRKGLLAGAAAIAGRHAAEIYQLDVLAEGIEDEKENFTRFLILSRDPAPYVPRIPSKTSLVFCLVNSPGVLYKALSVFAVTDIDLTKIVSRHIHTVLEAIRQDGSEDGELMDDSVERRWGYVFHVDIARHEQEQAVSSALKHLQEITTFYRVLGSYPSHCRTLHDVGSESLNQI